MSAERSFARRARAWLETVIERDLAAPQAASVKRLGEIALLAVTLGPDGRPWLERAWRGLDEGRRIQEAVAAMPAAAVTYLPFRWRGLRSTPLEIALADPAWARALGAQSRLVLLTTGTMLEAMGIAPPWSPHEVLAELGLFAPPSPSPAYEGMRAQLMAHVVFWQTKLGAEPAALGESERRCLEAALIPWCAKLVNAGDLDSLAEVLGAAACARLDAPPWAWRALLDGQDAEGWVPAQLASDGDRFHPTLVSLMAVEMAADRSAPVGWFAGAAVAADLASHYAT
jgi:hypothetical protein